MSSHNSQQLLLVKELFEEAQTLAFREDTFSTSKAILFLDLAVEQMLRTIIASISPHTNYKKDPDWYILWADASDAMQAKGFLLRNNIQLKSLHKDRNNVQHAGSTYHFTQARKYVASVEDMLSNVFQDVFRLDFFSYNLLALINNDDLRCWLQDAQQIFNEGGFSLVIAACNHAHSLVIKEVRKNTRSHNQFHNSIWLDDLNPKARAALLTAFKELDAKFNEQILSLEEELVAIGVGLSVMDARRFKQYGKFCPTLQTYDGQIHFRYIGGSPDELKEAASLMLNYLSKLIR